MSERAFGGCRGIGWSNELGVALFIPCAADAQHPAKRLNIGHQVDFQCALEQAGFQPFEAPNLGMLIHFVDMRGLILETVQLVDLDRDLGLTLRELAICEERSYGLGISRMH
jgi:hypothetical protein